MTNKNQMYYILSLKWSKGVLFVWWRPDDNGYVSDLDKAGKYSRKQIDEQPDYYDNGDSTLAVPCELVDKKAMRAVLRDHGTVGEWIKEIHEVGKRHGKLI